MESNFERLRREAEIAKQNYERAQQALEGGVNSCRHNFSNPEYDPIYKEGYTIPGDPPGTMGVDWRGPCYVEPKTTPRWKRVCKNCGKVEYTFQTKETISKSPVF